MRKNRFLIKLITLVLICFTFIGCADISFTRIYDAETDKISDVLTISLDRGQIPTSVLTSLDRQIKTDLSDYVVAVREISGVCGVGYEVPKEYTYVLTTEFTGYEGVKNVYGNRDIGPFGAFIVNKNRIWASENGMFLYKFQPCEDESILWAIKYFSQTSSESFYSKYYKLATGEDFNEENFTLDGLQITESFLTNLQYVYSNADKQVSKDGITQYVWDLTGKDLDYSLEIYGLRARSIGWYLVALGVSILTAVVLIIIAFTMKKKETNPDEEKIIVGSGDFEDKNEDKKD